MYKSAVTGPLVQASVDYAAMGLKRGQTISLMVREACAAKGQGFIPEIVLTLKRPRSDRGASRHESQAPRRAQ